MLQVELLRRQQLEVEPQRVARLVLVWEQEELALIHSPQWAAVWVDSPWVAWEAWEEWEVWAAWAEWVVVWEAWEEAWECNWFST